jgi:hypothetical protein
VIEVTGAEQFASLARALKEAGNKDLRAELYKGINRSVRPLRQAVKAEIPRRLPRRYGAVLARDLSVRTRRRPMRDPAIYLLGTAKNRDVRSLNRGRLRHPLFGNREHWFDQRVSSRWWEDPLSREAPAVRQELVRVMDEVAQKIARAT